MNAIQKYEALANEKQWDEALPVIRSIIAANPEIETSWFNYGVCLDELGRYGEAAEAFIKAQELNITDWGIHYRIFRSFFLADDLNSFIEFADYSCGLNPEIFEVLVQDAEFDKFTERTEFKPVRQKYAQV